MLVTLRAQRIHGQTFSSVWRLAFTLKTSASISSTIFKHCDTYSTIFFFFSLCQLVMHGSAFCMLKKNLCSETNDIKLTAKSGYDSIPRTFPLRLLEGKPALWQRTFKRNRTECLNLTLCSSFITFIARALLSLFQFEFDNGLTSTVKCPVKHCSLLVRIV